MVRVVRKLTGLLGNIFLNRSLLVSLAVKDFKRRFAGSYFGTVWGFVQPLLTVLIYWLVFQFGFRSGEVRDAPFILWFMCGIIPWLFVSEAISVSANSLLEYSYLVKKVVFNVNILPLVKIGSSFIIHICFIALLLVVAIFMGYWPSIKTLQLLYYCACSVLLVFGLSLITSSVTVFFRDMNQIISIVLLAGMWGTPIAWNPEQFTPGVQMILKLNPMYYIVEGYRDAIIGGAWFWQKYMQTTYFWLLTLFLLLVGAVVFDRLKPHFADVL